MFPFTSSGAIGFFPIPTKPLALSFHIRGLAVGTLILLTTYKPNKSSTNISTIYLVFIS